MSSRAARVGKAARLTEAARRGKRCQTWIHHTRARDVRQRGTRDGSDVRFARMVWTSVECSQDKL